MSTQAFARLGVLATVAAALFVYSDQLDFYFTDIDTFTLIETSRFHSLEELGSVLASPMMDGQLPNARFYRPIASLIWGAEEHVWGLNPRGYHLTGLTLHALNCLLLFWLILSTTTWQGEPSSERRSRLPRGGMEALAASILMAIHPITAETVPAIARRPDLLFCFFQLLSLCFALRYLRSKRWRDLSAIALCCVLALGSKDSAIIVTAIVGAYVFCFSKAETLRERVFDCIRCCLPALVGVVVYFGLRTWVLGGLGGYETAFSVPLESVVKSSTVVFVCSALCPGNLDQLCNKTYLPWLCVGMMALVIGSAARLRTEWFGATARRVAFALLCLGLFFTLYTVTRTVALTRTIYSVIPFLCIFFGWGVVDAGTTLAHLWSDRRAYPLRQIAMRLGLSAIFISVVAAAGYAGGRGIYLKEWRGTGGLVEKTLSMTEPQIEPLAAGTTVYTVNIPFKARAVPPVIRDQPILDDYSIQGWADLFHPEKELDVVGLTRLRINLATPQDLRSEISFNPKSAELAIKVFGDAMIEPYIQQRRWGKLHPLREISSYASAEESGLTIQLTPEAFEPKDIAFLVFLGGRVELHGADAWSTSFEPENR